jgi:GWxTD domain-containing protein
MRCLKFLLFLIFLGIGLNALSSATRDKQDKSKNGKKAKQEAGMGQYYKKWLDEDVSPIITNEERSVFKSLNNDEERKNFIKIFWDQRNPDPGSSYNSFKEEHYRRIAYANKHFASGVPGWKTDRGMIYIKFGKPDDIESHPMGGPYTRPFYEGGGDTDTYPFEKWTYRHIDGVGDGIEIEFVDQSMSGEYRISQGPDDKDALRHVPGAGLKLAELMGMANKANRAYITPGISNDPTSPQNLGLRAQDQPFARMAQDIALQRPPEFKFKDPRPKVSAMVYYDSLAYDLKTYFLKLTPKMVLVPVTIEINNSELQFKREQDINRAKINVYGKVTIVSGSVAAEWEDALNKDFNDVFFQIGKDKPSEYQHIVAVAPGQRYKLDLVLQDVNSKKMGTKKVSLDIPKYVDNALQSSTIILAGNITPAPMNSSGLDQYVIGDMRIVPLVKHEYTKDQYLVHYMQIYNAQVDQASLRPSLDVEFLLKINGKLVEEIKSTAVNSEQYFYGQRVVLVGKIPLKNLAPGKYTLEISVRDNIANRSLSTSTEFMVKELKPAIS